MKIITLSVMIIGSFASLNAQEICMVSADFDDATSYLVMWEQFDNTTGLDSVFIYRKQDGETVFAKVGAVDISSTAPTYFKDLTANTAVLTRYLISTIDSSGNESAFSLWHSPVVLDFDPVDGRLSWRKYKIENQVDESYISSYSLEIYESGLNLWQQSWEGGATDTFAIDPNYTGIQDLQVRYAVFTGLPNCNIQTKANINRSRSNIKQQFSNASAELNENELKFSIYPNPSSNYIFLWTDNAQKAQIVIKGIDGKIVLTESKGSSNKILLNIESLKEGVYFLSIEQKGRVYSKKFIKY